MGQEWQLLRTGQRRNARCNIFEMVAEPLPVSSMVAILLRSETGRENEKEGIFKPHLICRGLEIQRCWHWGCTIPLDVSSAFVQPTSKNMES